jgi:hypothetical protein
MARRRFAPSAARGAVRASIMAGKAAVPLANKATFRAVTFMIIVNELKSMRRE